MSLHLTVCSTQGDQTQILTTLCFFTEPKEWPHTQCIGRLEKGLRWNWRRRSCGGRGTGDKSPGPS